MLTHCAGADMAALREVVGAAETACATMGSGPSSGINYTKMMVVMCRGGSSSGGSGSGGVDGTVERKVEELSASREMYGYLESGPEPAGRDVVRRFEVGPMVEEVRGPAVVLNVLGGVVRWRRKDGAGPEELLQGWGMSLYVRRGDVYEGEAVGSCVLSVSQG